MPALVLCDGAPSAIKAVELAGFPDFFLSGTDQLILVHTCNASRQLLQAPTLVNQSDTASKETGAAAAHGGSTPTMSPRTSASVARSSAPATSTDAVHLAVSNITPEILETHKSFLPTPVVLHTHISAIKESKLLKDFLSYKFECTNVPFATQALKCAAEEELSLTARQAKKSVAANSRPVTSKSLKDDSPGLRAQMLSYEECIARASTDTALYARQRAEHHKVKTIFLGVGNSTDGKVIQMGATTDAVVRDLSSKYALYCIKNDGFTLRATTTLIRYVVIVVVGNGSPPATESLVLENSEVPKIGEGEKSVKSANFGGESDIAGGAPGNLPSEDPHTVTSRDSIELPQIAITIPAPPPVDALADGCAAVRYALSRRRSGSKDTVAVLLLAEPQESEENVKTYISAFEDLLSSAKGSKTDSNEVLKEVTSPENAEKPKDAPLTEATPPDGEPKEAAVEVEVKPAEPASTQQSSPPAAPESRIDEPWPPVSVCTFKTSKHVPLPTVWNSSGQIIKSLQQRKLEFAVVPSSAPPPIIKTVLSHNKPHVIIVPPSFS